MTSRVEELQRMCDNINENGGLDSGEWHTALLAQIAQNLAVIADVMMADRKTEPQTDDRCIGCKFTDGEICYCPEDCGVCDRDGYKIEPNLSEIPTGSEPQTERSE